MPQKKEKTQICTHTHTHTHTHTQKMTMCFFIVKMVTVNVHIVPFFETKEFFSFTNNCNGLEKKH